MTLAVAVCDVDCDIVDVALLVCDAVCVKVGVLDLVCDALGEMDCEELIDCEAV